MRLSSFWEMYREDRKLVKCLVCERGCVLAPGLTGFCGNYVNHDGKLYDIGYGLLSAVEPRPIEIKPLFHYYPGSWALTFSGWGCNFKCPWCQNYHLSMVKPRREYSILLSPLELVSKAIEWGQDGLCASFNEPTIHAEYLLDVGFEAKKHGLYLSMVTNGYMTMGVLKKLIEAGYTGFSIDIKGCPDTYRKYFGCDPLIAYRNAKYIIDNGGHVEMVYLVIPGVNDWRECYEWVIEKHLEYLGSKIPLHINRYYPAYKFTAPPTSFEKLYEIYEYAKRSGIEFVYIGNIHEQKYQDTRCPRCGKTLIVRRNYGVVEYYLDNGKCPRCGYPIPVYGEYRGGKPAVYSI